MKRTALASAALIIMLVLSILFSLFFIAAEAEHDCSGEDDCPICVFLALCEGYLREIKIGLIRVVTGFLIIGITVPHTIKKVIFHIADTPVSLKVQMNN